MPIITKRGDQGETDLLFHKKAPKISARIEALGATDELNSHLGLARTMASDEALTSWIDGVQKNLINLMGEFATEEEDYQKYIKKGYGRIQENEVIALETLAAEHEDSGHTFRGWIRPGNDGNQLTAQLHVCRTVCRRAERRSWAIPLPNTAPRLYLNRLADVLWLIASQS